jgi:hypothetical protein
LAIEKAVSNEQLAINKKVNNRQKAVGNEQLAINKK